LTTEQWAQLFEARTEGAPPFGFVDDPWTTKRIADLI
jgi:hypothetical protein